MMALAQGLSSSMPPNEAALTAAELREILEYEKIVQFRDAIVAGTHPRIKVPPHLVGKQVNNAARNVSSPSRSTPYRASAPKESNRSISGTNHELSSPLPYFNINRSPNNQRAVTNGLTAMRSKSEINPILLEKSDDLIKAEIQLQRQRLERALREQIEQQRLSAKLQTSEAIPNFDVAEVLSKALAIVQPSTAAEVDPSAGVRSSASDSFDENTFYSSQHDTPEPSSTSQGQQEPLPVQTDGVVSVDEQPDQNYSANSQVGDQDVVMTGASLSTNNHLPGQSYSKSKLSPLQQTSHHAAIHNEQARKGNSNHSNSLRETVKATSDELLRQAFEDDAESQLIRGHDLSPYAPQPARVSPLATARNPPVLRETLPADEAPPAQVASLRKSGISSTDSSPKMGKPTNKKKDKKKKRKSSGKEDVPTPEPPYIKLEPRSPSPFGVGPLPRPHKRGRQTGQFASELNYDEPRYEEIQEHVVGRIPEQHGYERYEERYEPEPRRPEAIYERVERGHVEYRRVDDGHYARRPQSPAVYALPYASGDVRPVRAASHAIIDRRPREEPVYYREQLPRASVRPDADHERSRSPVVRERKSPIPMGPPRQPVRIVVDAYGREYIDPAPAPSMRQPVAPPPRYREGEVFYERPPVRTLPARTPVEYEEDGVIYRRPSPAGNAPRRVITQPEYAVPDHRAYRQREYSVRSMAPPGEDYIQLRGAPERRQLSHVDEVPREYIPRAASVRPAPTEQVRYEIPRDYRVQSVRPEMAPREMASQPQREYSVRQVESGPRREQVSGREEERYYDQVPTRRPAAEVAFIERPRAREQSILVYADDVRREVRDVYR